METKTLEAYFIAELEDAKAKAEALRKRLEAYEEDEGHGVGTATPEHVSLVMYDVDTQTLEQFVRSITEETGSFDEWADALTDAQLAAWALSNRIVTVSREVSDYVVKVGGRRLAVVAPTGANDTGEVANLDSPLGWGVWVEDDDDISRALSELVAYEAGRC